ncbi:hypothetical protein AMAG_14416 [Allomyces macrogynus ATCC 38327]|uniref:Uncharacterized protein n=1 Tax=Allomyces macrogynus (strain ATCC 38327) TaxID=578462 RepID=A0A0L0T682_ALLM3|nr:hypothetical protein AMAG_14416 [Allomyces macrogynus ATCC 38327]|eukprot:KNE70267.1 hypothetical protein AMAG_14416 [Allomyces macrogynus ATCC 38327]
MDLRAYPDIAGTNGAGTGSYSYSAPASPAAHAPWTLYTRSSPRRSVALVPRIDYSMSAAQAARSDRQALHLQIVDATPSTAVLNARVVPVAALELAKNGPGHRQAPYFDTLEVYLPQLVATFLTRMVYSEEELADLGAFDQDDTHVPDAVQDVKPRHVKGKAHEAGGKASPGEDGGAKSDDDANDDDDDDDDGEDDPDSLANAWTLRKCSAAALDALASIYEEKILPPLLPQLQARLASPEWLQREGGILALRAVPRCERTGWTALAALVPSYCPP